MPDDLDRLGVSACRARVPLMYKTIKTRAGTWTVVGPGYGDLGLLPSVAIDMGRDMSGHRATATGGRYAFHETAERAVEYGPIWDRREDAERCAAAMQRAYDAAKDGS